jgi:DNA-binding Xre family transcriptional regulator
MNTSKAIRAFQDKKDMSCQELALAMDVTPQQVTRWRTMPDLKLSIVLKLCAVFKVSISEFIEAG